MTLELIRNVLGWCALINMAILLWWLLFVTLGHDWMYRMHRRFIPLSVEQFNLVNYAGMAFFKLAILFFNIVPYLVLRIVA